MYKNMYMSMYMYMCMSMSMSMYMCTCDEACSRSPSRLPVACAPNMAPKHPAPQNVSTYLTACVEPLLTTSAMAPTRPEYLST